MTRAAGERRAAAGATLHPVKRTETSTSPPRPTRPNRGPTQWVNRPPARREARRRRWWRSAASAWPCSLHTSDKTGWALRGREASRPTEQRGITVRDTKTAFGTLDCPPLGETLLTITITFHLIICMVYKDIRVQQCGPPPPPFLLRNPFITTPPFYII